MAVRHILSEMKFLDGLREFRFQVYDIESSFLELVLEFGQLCSERHRPLIIIFTSRAQVIVLTLDKLDVWRCGGTELLQASSRWRSAELTQFTYRRSSP